MYIILTISKGSSFLFNVILNFCKMGVVNCSYKIKPALHFILFLRGKEEEKNANITNLIYNLNEKLYLL